VVSFRTQPVYHQGKDPRTHWIGGWVAPRATLDMVVMRKYPYPRWESNPGRPAHSLVTILTELPQLSKYGIKTKYKVNLRLQQV
jgi:hypothetical protein